MPEEKKYRLTRSYILTERQLIEMLSLVGQDATPKQIEHWVRAVKQEPAPARGESEEQVSMRTADRVSRLEERVNKIEQALNAWAIGR